MADRHEEYQSEEIPSSADVPPDTVILAMKHALPWSEARFALVHAEDGWTTNMPVEHFLAEDALFVMNHDGRALRWWTAAVCKAVAARSWATS